MAEFASAVVGLAAAAAQVGGSLYDLIHTLKDAPNEFLTLSDEFNDFRKMLARLLDMAKSKDMVAIETDDFDAARKRGEEIVKEIGVLIAKVQKGRDTGNRDNGVDRLRWLRHVKQAKKLHKKLRAHKVTVCNIIIMEMLQCSSRSGLRISRLEVRLAVIAQHQVSLLDTHNKMLLELKDTRQVVDKVLQAADKSSQTATSELQKAFSDDETMNGSLPIRAGHLSRLPPKWSARVPLRCLDDCQCRCHYRVVMRFPAVISDRLGHFFLGCSNLPWYLSNFVSWSEQTCRRSYRQAEADLLYLAPPWIGSIVGNLDVAFSLRKCLLKISLQTRHVVPYDSPILVCVREGDVQGVRKLFQSGEASINDVDPYGLGLLYYASFYCWRSAGREAAINMCRLLVHSGANQDWVDEIGNTPKENMIAGTLMTLARGHAGPCELKGSDFVHIAQSFSGPTAHLVDDFVEDRELPVLHQVLLGIERNMGSLEDYLAGLGQAPLPPEIIDASDACGQTALAWAVEYGWPEATKVLLHYGASARRPRPSLRGEMPLLNLAIACPASTGSGRDLVDVVKLLLEAGAEVNSVDHEGWTALHVAASWNNAAVIEELVRFAGGALTWDALTNDGQTGQTLSLGAGFDKRVQDIFRNQDASQVEVGSSDSESDEFFDSVDVQCQ